MTKQGTAIYIALGILIAFTMFSSMLKTFLFSQAWFTPENTIFPVLFYSSLADFIVLIILYSLVSNVRLFDGTFNDDESFLATIGGFAIGWISIRFLSVGLSSLYSNGMQDVSKLAESPGFEGMLRVFLTLFIVVISREILLRGFMYQFLARGIGDRFATLSIPLFVAILAGHLEHYSWIEFINTFLFNLLLCYCYRLYKNLMLPATLALSMYFSAFMIRAPIRELEFLERPNLLTGLEKSWFGSEITVFAGIPMTVILVLLLLITRYLVKNKRVITTEDMLDYPEAPVRRRYPRRMNNSRQWIDCTGKNFSI